MKIIMRKEVNNYPLDLNNNINYSEVWLQVNSSPHLYYIKDYYWISNYGRVYNDRIKNIAKLNLKESGYVHIGLQTIYDTRITIGIHRLEMYVFSPYGYDNYDNLFVNHINGIKNNNYIENLEWCTPSENIIHAFKTGLKLPKIGEENPSAILSNLQVHEICKLLEDENILYKDICKQLKIDTTHNNLSIISDIKNKKVWTHISSLYNISNKRKNLGEAQYNSKLTEIQVHQICKLLQENKYSYKEICNIINIEPTHNNTNTITEIKMGRSWRHISKEYNLLNNKVQRLSKTI